ncbi:hypothetical protein LA59_17610 [Vibrio harveyi]|uniref:DUF4200 domain-containing protein n=1 Tax=Vibrio harveyi TaxID=669 RepID=UPI00053958BF|nr:DUF4200 domain-containing protein [Vibrio harveyi]AIV07277.1 hypothetical protein LA59_17610 [Vibrio harveyi]
MKTKLILSALSLTLLGGCASTYIPQPAPESVAQNLVMLPMAARKCNMEPFVIANLDGAIEYSKSTWASEPERYTAMYNYLIKHAETFDFTPEYCKDVEIAAYKFIREADAHRQKVERNAQIQRENQRQLNQDLKDLNRDLQHMNRDNMQMYQNMQRNNRQCLTNSYTGITTCV